MYRKRYRRRSHRACPHGGGNVTPVLGPAGPGRPAGGPGFLPRNNLIGRLRDGFLTRLFYRQLDRYLDDFNETRRRFDLAPLSTGREIIDLYHRADLRLIQTSEVFDVPITPAAANVRYVGPVLGDPDWSGEDLRSSAKAKQIREAVQRVLHEQEFRRRAEQMQRIIDEDVANDRALRELEAVGLRGDLPGAGHRHDGVTEPISASGGS